MKHLRRPSQESSNWLKYNSMYIKMTGDKTQWYPTCKVHGCFMSKAQIKKFDYKNYVDDYYNNIYEDDRQLKLF